MPSFKSSTVAEHHLKDWEDILRCPHCASVLDFQLDPAQPTCSQCRTVFPQEEGIPVFFAPTAGAKDHEVTETVKAFYEQTPFPSYDKLDTKAKLRACNIMSPSARGCTRISAARRRKQAMPRRIADVGQRRHAKPQSAEARESLC